MDDVVFDEKTNSFVCSSCFNESHVEDVTGDPIVDDAIKSVSDLKNRLVKYFCVSCRYHFVRSKKNVSLCPYCGSNNLEILDGSANSFL